LIDVEITARDKAGNESATFEAGTIRVDRTPPTIYAQSAVPYVLSNTGSNPYTTTLSYRLSADAADVTVKIYHEGTGQLVKTFTNASTSITWNAGSSLPTGSYQFQIIAEDSVGNTVTAYATCVKDGIAPVISFPAKDNDKISGTIAIKGTATDPDWTNDKGFKEYRVYYKEGADPSTVRQSSPLGASWKTDFIEIPAANKGRPMQGNSTLAYFYTTGLKNGTYTTKVVAEEEGGATVSSTRVVEIDNDSTQSSSNSPYIELLPIQSSIDFKSDDSNKLSIGFSNSVKPANVHIEVVPAGRDLPVFYKQFPNVAGAPFTGQPTYTDGKELGYFIWKDAKNTWHIKWSHDGKNHRFSGNIIPIGGGQLKSWDTNTSGGIDFTLDSNVTQLMITPKIDDDPTNPQIYASNVYLGAGKQSVDYLPIMIDVKNDSLMDMMGGVSSQKGGYNPSSSTCNWDGKLSTGGYADSGNYIVRVRAEGADGVGIATAEGKVSITTPFEVKNIETTNATFNTLGAPDRVTVSYNVSKDSKITALVYDYSKNLVAILLSDEKVLGVLNSNNKHSFSWKGNYPLSNSSTIVTSGNYIIKLIVSALDGSGSFTKEIPGIAIEKTFQNENYAKLEPVGDEGYYNGSLVRMAEGESPYYYEAKASGLYHPPRDFSYTLSAAGKQRFTMYPYVPFAGLMHRGFDKVKVKALIQLRVNYHYYDGYRFLAGEIWADGDYTDEKKVSFNYTPDNAILKESRKVYPQKDRGRITSIDVKATIYTADGSFVLDKTTEWKKLPASGVLTDKGMFLIKGNESEQPETHRYYYQGIGWKDVTDQWPHVANLEIELASPIKYSRLTNRFVPWYGFVNKNNSLARNFALTLGNINTGLGFPGKKFFDDPEAKPDAPHSSLANQLAANISNKSTWSEQVAAMNDLAKQANLLKYKDSLDSSVGYDSYLADEYFEFIPITTPAGSDFVRVNDSTYTAQTSVALLPSASGSTQSQNTFTFDWPNPDANISTWQAIYGIGGTNYRTLLGGGTIDKPEFAQKWDAYGGRENVCFYELDLSEVNKSKNEAKGSVTFYGKTLYYKSSGKSSWTSDKSTAELLPVPSNVENSSYSVNTLENQLRVELSGGSVYAEDQTTPLSWSGETIVSPQRLFNSLDFCGRRKINIFADYKIADDYTSALALQYSFLKKDAFARTSNTNIDNPNIDIQKWEVEVCDKEKVKNEDLKVEKIETGDDHTKDTFTLQLDSFAKEKRFVEIRGTVSGPYELMYFDGNNWQSITKQGSGKSGTLAWWNVNRLNGKHTVLLKTASYISTQDVYIGTMVKSGEEKDVFSAYRRAHLKFPSGAFTKDEFATITPVTMTEIKIRNRPIFMTHGPIVEAKPSPYKFNSDKKPTLRFLYTFEDLKNLGFWSGNASSVNVGDNLGLGLNIHQITGGGDLQIVSNNKQSVIKDANGDLLYAFEAPLDHFSTYTLVNGKFKLSAPVVFSDRYITNKSTVNLWGTAESESEIRVFVSSENKVPDFTSVAPAVKGYADKSGNFKFDGIKLLQEGKNYLYVAASRYGENSVFTYSDLEIVKDTVPPIASASPNLTAFSPNSDGKWDTAVFTMAGNEKGKLQFVVGTAISQMVTVEANEQVQLVWGENGFNIYRQAKDGSWFLKDTVYASSKFVDGDYPYTVFSIDEAGNISNNVAGHITVDTTPPVISNLDAAPNPFTPNGDGIKDTTAISYKLSEPAYATANILRDDGVLFRKYSESVTKTGSWTWDGRGARNELLGGTYSYYISAEDAVGNTASSETKTVKVDHTPSLLAYGYAEPDPFSPLAGDSTYIKYYLARDNCYVNVYIENAEGKPLVTLVNNELRNKGENKVAWKGEKADSGTYQFRITAQDADGGAPAYITNTVLVDNNPPVIFTYPVAVDYVSRKAVFKYNLSEAASIEIAVYDQDGKLIQNIYKGAKGQGTYSANYQNTGSVDLGQKYFRVVAEDKARNSSEKKSDFFTLSVSDSLRITNVSVTPAQITPNGDSHTDMCRISYSLAGGAPEYKVTLKILDSANSTVRTILNGEVQNPGVQNYYWSGEIDTAGGGKSALKNDGVYHYELKVTDKLGTEVKETGEILAVVSKPSVSIAVSPAIFSPNSDSSSDSVLFTYTVDYPNQWITGEASVKLTIKSSTGEAVFTKSFNHSAGTYSYAWGDPVSAGTYYAYLDATDALGTPALTQTATLTVDYTAPSVSLLGIDHEIFSPNVNGRKDSINLSYGLSKDSHIKIDVLDANNKVIRNLQPQTLTGSYWIKAIPAISWNGKDNNGQLAADGTYSIGISAKDPAGNASLFTKTIKVDNAVPAVPGVNILPRQTNLGTILISGEGEAGAEVEIFNNDQLALTASIDAYSRFNANLQLALGNNRIKARTVDPAGNESAFSVEQTVNYETNDPVFSNIKFSANPCKAGPLTIEFTVSETLESNPIVKINGSSSTYNLVLNTYNSPQYTYTYNVTTSDKLGTAVVSFEGVDLAGNKGTYTDSRLVIDTAATKISNVQIKPTYAKLNAKVTIDFTVDEPLLRNPTVEVGGKPASFVGKNGLNYSYSYVIQKSDPDGYTPVSAEVIDVANNISVNPLAPSGELGRTVEGLIVDQTKPLVGNIQITPDPAKAGIVTINFTVSETLESDPVVKINNRAAERKGTQKYSYQYTVTGYDPQGKTNVSFDVTDLALNKNASLAAFTVDTIAPIFSNIFSTPLFVKAGDSASIRFDSSEKLAFNPDVSVNSNSCTYNLVLNTYNFPQYTYAYTVTGNDINGLATIEVAGEDFAGNKGSAKSDKVSESFTIDTIKPTVASYESSPNNTVISTPSPFTPNNDTIDDSTTVYYNLSEAGYATVRVYAVADKANYTSADFTNSNRSYNLVNSRWQARGEQHLVWNGRVSYNLTKYDKDNNGYADSGKYAFIVEVRDAAGNITERKYGGTVWVQDAILEVAVPEQWEADELKKKGIINNPHPRIFSPNVYSDTTMYFRVNKGIYPKTWKPPEWISAQAFEDDISWESKTVSGNDAGTYEAKVYDKNGTLIKTIVSSAKIKSSLLMAVKWDGKDSSGSFAADGMYKIVVTVRDFTGVMAKYGSPFERWMILDRTAPDLKNLTVTNGYISPNSSQSTAIKNTTIKYDLGDNFAALTNEANIVSAKIEVYNNLQNIIGLQLISREVLAATATYTKDWDGLVTGSSNYVGTANSGGSIYPDGTYTYRITAGDVAGNNSVATGSLIIDTGKPTLKAVPESQSWKTTLSPTLDVDAGSAGIKFAQYAWHSSSTVPTSGWTDFTGGSAAPQNSDGEWYLHLRAEDNAGNSSAKLFSVYQRDNTPPVIGASPTSRGWGSSNISVTVNGADSYSKIYSMEYGWSNSTSAPSSWTSYTDGQTITQSGDGTWYLHLKATDNVGLSAGTYTGPYYKDSVAPTIIPPSGTLSFNPYLNSQSLSFSASDSSPSSGSLTVTAAIKYNGTTIKDLTLTKLGDTYSTSWDGKNSSDDYVNEGNYTLEIYAKDGAGNFSTSTPTITLADDQRITNNTIDSISPYLIMHGDMILKWIEGYSDAGSFLAEAEGGEFNDWYTNVRDRCYAGAAFTVDHIQNLTINLKANGGYGSDSSGNNCFYKIKTGDSPSNYNPEKEYGDPTTDLAGAYWAYPGNLDKTVTFTLSPGKYYFITRVIIGTRVRADISMSSTISDRKHYQYSSASSDLGKTWGEIAGPTNVDSYYTNRPSGLEGKDYGFEVYVQNGDLYYKKTRWLDQVSWTAKITSSGKTSNPSIRNDTSDNVYVSWQDTRDGNSEIYFQKVPSNFAPINSPSMTALKVKNDPTTLEAKTATEPEITYPKDSVTVTTLRPEFKWIGLRGTTDYRINLGKTALLSTPDRTYNKNATQTEASPTDGSIPSFVYSIHEFDSGLDRGTWQWQVLANPGATNEAKSAIATFIVDPPMTITGITNYPNPFNPNKEKTKLRYRLGAEADDVIIRIYDLTGSLVRELDGTTHGESSSIWSKYNDVEWDGRNDRGDLVLNGIYPFEVVAKLGGISANGRGKIAVLK